MRNFTDDTGRPWSATAAEEDTPRHHGRWYMVFQAANGLPLPMPEVRWQTRATAERTLRTMGDFELRRRLHNVLGRSAAHDGPSAAGHGPAYRIPTDASAG